MEDQSKGTLQFGSDTEPWKEFYALLGYCINQWSYVDSKLFDCCSFALGTDEKRTAIVYHSWISFGARKGLVDELMALALAEKPDLAAQWATIVKDIDALSPFRNTIAHQPANQQGEIVWDMWAEGGPTVVRQRVWLEVNTAPSEILRGKKKPQTITLEDLKAHAEGLGRLLQSLEVFRKEVGLAPAPEQSSPPDASPQQAPSEPPPHARSERQK